jgi:type VI secretion system protein ImpH
MEDMAANGWRDGPDLNRLLLEQPHRVEFYQAVRLIEALRPGFGAVGDVTARAGEPVSFEQVPDLRFHATDVTALSPGGEGEPHRMSVSILGLAGPTGPLPQPFIELLLERLRRKDRGFKAFLDLFFHRLAALLYRVHAATRPGFDNKRPSAGRHGRHVLSVAGLGLDSAAGRLNQGDAALMPFAGILAHRQRSAVALERVLTAMFGLTVRLHPFVGRWHTLSQQSLSRLGRQDGANNRLGRDAMVGSRAWVQDGQIELAIGPVAFAQFAELLPAGLRHQPMASVVRLHVGRSVDVRLRLRLAAGQCPPLRLGSASQPGALLGWTTWLGRGNNRSEDSQVTVPLAGE